MLITITINIMFTDHRYLQYHHCHPPAQFVQIHGWFSARGGTTEINDSGSLKQRSNELVILDWDEWNAQLTWSSQLGFVSRGRWVSGSRSLRKRSQKKELQLIKGKWLRQNLYDGKRGDSWRWPGEGHEKKQAEKLKSREMKEGWMEND